MRKYIYMVILLMMAITTTQAQRMLPGQKGIEFNMGSLPSRFFNSNYYVNAGLTLMKKGGNYFWSTGEYGYERTGYKEIQIPLETFLLEAGYSLQLLSSPRKFITLNGGLMATGGYERINRGKAILYDGAEIKDKGGFVFGAAGRLSVETYLADQWVLLIQGRTKILWNTSREQFRPSIGVGLRFNF